MSSKQADLVITNGRIVTADLDFLGAIAVRDGVIVAIGEPADMPPADETLDASGLTILPGAIDVHVHFRDPGYDHKEDWESGTIAAAFGGVTTVFDMPNTIPTVDNPVALAQKHEIAASKAHVDYGLYAVLGESSLEHVQALAEAGIIGFKLYMGNTFGRIPSPSTGVMLELFEKVAPTGLRVSLHAETNSVMERRETALRAAGRNTPLDHLASRPAVVAIEAVERAATLAEWTGARIHVLHISSADELRPLAEAKARGVDVTGETGPHYLMLGTDDYARFKGVIRVNPPVREASNHEPLWAALKSGLIDMVATDHAPHTPEEKQREIIWEVDCGFPGVETQMPLMLTAVAQGRLTLQDYVRASSLAPAKTFGLYPQKGALAPGSDADFALVDLDANWTIRDADLHSRSRISPFDGRPVKGRVRHTIVRGRFVVRDGKLMDETRGTGRSVHSIQNMPAPAPRNRDKTLAAVTGSGDAL